MNAPEALHPNQVDLVDRLLGGERVSVALVAPPGTGKTLAVTTAIDSLVRNDPSSTRVLVVAPSAIGGYIAEKLQGRDVPTQLQHLRGAELRRQDKGKATMEPGVYFVSSELVRQPWAGDVLVSLPWSLVFVDEATYGGHATDAVIARFANTATTQRLCAASSVAWPEPPTGLELVEWNTATFRRTVRRTTTIHFERSPEEIRIRQRLTEIEDQFGADRSIRAALDSAWRSSASAFEFMLARHSSVLAESSEAAGSKADPIVRARTSDVREGSARARWDDPNGAAIALSDLLREMGTISQDSKLEAFLAHIGAQLPATRIVVFTAMRQTGIYLDAALKSRQVPVSLIDGARAPGDRVPAENARVVIVTDAVLPAVDLSGFVGVSYDLPWNPERLEARWSNLGEAGGEGVMATLVDASRTDSVEHELARKLALLDDALGGVP